MPITVKFFARLREELNLDEIQVSAAVGMSMSAVEVWQLATKQVDLPEKVLIAINQEYASAQSEVNDNDEVAFFPPVTGG